ncbi:MAG: acetyl-CoA decarbonylase/synthase complex subunit gamma [Desulforudis sp.]|jgi:acetyl-CoA decarbonylase/synthase complex subunit gamma|nr:acetyl-CoA decarbonylase/synthase complex subunit gamma [Clostridia bacterium]RJX17338.1 MAG: acetyl-CoA decarbonylase/synthase complex subunit gamma [Desulforudis sp.]
MALNGLAIYKLLPKTNCKDCGQATCLAFAMQMAAGKASLDACPHASDEAKETLGAASEPAIALVEIGTGEKVVKLGNETVLFRHDKRFVHPTAIGILVSDRLDDAAVEARVQSINGLFFDRLGETYGVDLVAVRNDSSDAARFVEVVRKVAELSPLTPALLSEDPVALRGALEVVAGRKPLVYGAHPGNYEALTALAKEFAVPLGVRVDGLDELAELAEKIAKLGHKQLLLDSGARDVKRVLADQTLIRRLAIMKRFRPFGYPTICFADNRDGAQRVLDSVVYAAKYAGVLIIDRVDPAEILPLITWRLNVYTDPQKPIAIEAKVYEVGTPGRDAPVFLTTNFSLTYYCVMGDIESARTPAYILPVDTDGTSVLTAWAAGKVTPEKIKTFLETSGIGDRVDHRRLIIPGGLAVMTAKLKEITGWDILVGPRESSVISAFLRDNWQ